MKVIMILGITKELFPIVDIAKKNGYQVLATDRDKESKGLKYVDIPVVLDALDKDKVLTLASKYNIAAIITRTEMLLPTVSYVCDKLDLLGPSSFVSSISNDKYQFREFMKESGIAVPSYFLVNKDSTLKEIKSILQYPFILKPVDFSGSCGVNLIKNDNEFLDKKTLSLGSSKSKKAIAESFLHGLEYSIETISQNNITHIIAITEKHLLSEGSFIEDRHIIPANLSSKDKDCIEEEVLKMAKSLGMNNCISHTEVMLTSTGPVIIETAARPAGDNICFKLIELATGISMYQNMFNLSIGRKVELIKNKKMFSGIQYITATNKSDITKAIDNNLGNIIEFNFEDKKVTEVNQSSDREGYFICCGNNRDDLISQLNLFR